VGQLSGQVHSRVQVWEERTAWRLRRLWSWLPPRSRFYARTTQYRSERAAIVRRLILLLLAFAALAGFAILVGYESYGAGKHGDALDLRQPFHALAVTVTRPGVAVPVAFALLVLLAWLFRRVRLAWLVWGGGPIFIPDFQKGGEMTPSKAAQLTTQFRERIAVLRLQAATPSPGAAPEGTFVDVLSDGDDPSGSVLGLLLRLLRAAVPAYAIEVQGILRERDAQGKYGVTVQVVQTPGQPSPVIEVHATSWGRAICRAADEATAAILPRSRLCRGTWAAWRGYAMPEGLLSAYESAAKFEQERRFDEALDQYWETLRLDPTNLAVRLRLGQLQEKAGLLLAALTNYQRILAFANPGAKNLPRGMYRRGARREWDRALSVAKYRAAILLGDGSIVRQWSTPSRQKGVNVVRRERVRADRRNLLEPLATMHRFDPTAERISKGVQQLLKVSPRLKRGSERKALLDLTACGDEASRELLLSLPRWESARWRELLTRRTVALSRMSIDRRRQVLLDPSVDPLDPPRLAALDRSIMRAGWRPGPLSGRCPTWLRRWQWHEHYNAACVYAAYLSVGEDDTNSVRRMLVRKAIKRLERAITTRDSEFVVTWRDWIISEDRALDCLRKTPEFLSFEAMYFPSRIAARTMRSRPHEPQRLAEVRYARDLLTALAQSWHCTWHDRAKNVAEDVHVLVLWCEQEREIWGLVGKVLDDWYDWRPRRDLLERANVLLAEREAVCVKFSRYEDRLSVQDGSDDAHNATQERRRAEQRLSELGALLKQPGNGQGALHYKSWIEAMRDHDPHAAISLDMRARFCAQNALVWDRMSRWLHAGEEDGVARDRQDALVQTARNALEKELREAASLWNRRESVWSRCLLAIRR
jgi:hypothetical protein